MDFDVFAAEDIKAADGVSEDYFKADEKVGTITTDSNGIAQMLCKQGVNGSNPLFSTKDP